MEEHVSHKPRKNIVVLLTDGHYKYSIAGSLLYGDGGSFACEQLVHQQMVESKGSILRRLGRWLGLLSATKYRRSRSVVEAVERAYEFVLLQYEPGDQVICLAELWCYGIEGIAAVELLVLCLTTRTRPAQARNIQNTHHNGPVAGGIPVKGVVVGVLSSREYATAVNDRILSCLPTSIEHIVSAGYPAGDASTCSCSSIRKPNGHVVSKSVCIYSGLLGMDRALIHASKHLIHYRPTAIQAWDKRRPTWTHTYTTNSTILPQGIRGWLHRPCFAELGLLRGAEHTGPRGMCRHQLEVYRHYTSPSDYRSCLVWKSFSE